MYGTAAVWAFSTLLVTLVIATVYFLIFFMAFYILGWAIAHFIRPVLALLSHE